MENVRYCFVILHYQNINDTIKCINSIEELELYDESGIVIIDNGSPDKSGEKLLEMYGSHENIEIILSDVNHGFSKANNQACKLAREKFQAELYIVSNNDIVFQDRGFLSKLNAVYNSKKYQVMGPDIYNPQLGVHQSPLSVEAPGKMSLTKTIILNKMILAMTPITNNFIIKYFRYLDKKVSDAKGYDTLQEGVCLMGACIIVSKNFLDKKVNLFYPETKFYYEEYILWLYCNSNKVEMAYIPELKVIHNSGGSTKRAYSEELQRDKFVIKNTIDAAKVCRDYHRQMRK